MWRDGEVSGGCVSGLRPLAAVRPGESQAFPGELVRSWVGERAAVVCDSRAWRLRGVPRGRPASPPLVSRRRPSGPLWAGSSEWCRPGPQRPSLGERTGSGPASGAESSPGAASGPLLRRERLLAPKLPHRGGPRALWGPQAVV